MSKFHHQCAKRTSSVHRHQFTRALEQPPDSSTVEDDEGEGRACHPHITAAQLYRMCRRGRFPANFDGDAARFHIDPSDFYAARSRLHLILNSSDRRMPFRLSYDPRFSTTGLRLHPLPLHDLLAREVLVAFGRPKTERDTAGFLELIANSEQELKLGGVSMIRTPDLLVVYEAPSALKQNPKHVAVLEVGLTQSYKKLRALVDTWFEARPALNTVLIIKLTEKPRYVRHTNIQHVLGQGMENFPSLDDIDTADIRESNPDDPSSALSMYGMPMLGRITGFMEIWMQDTKTGKPTQKGERINFYGGESTPPDTILPLQQFMPKADKQAKIVLEWGDVKAAINSSRDDTARKRCWEVLEMARTGRVTPRGRK